MCRQPQSGPRAKRFLLVWLGKVPAWGKGAFCGTQEDPGSIHTSPARHILAPNACLQGPGCHEPPPQPPFDMINWMDQEALSYYIVGRGDQSF